MSESVGRSHGQNRERDAGVRQHLNDVVDGAVASAGKDGVIAGRNGLSQLFFRVNAGAGENQFGLDVGTAEQR